MSFLRLLGSALFWLYFDVPITNNYFSQPFNVFVPTDLDSMKSSNFFNNRKS